MVKFVNLGPMDTCPYGTHVECTEKYYLDRGRKLGNTGESNFRPNLGFNYNQVIPQGYDTDPLTIWTYPGIRSS